MGSNNIVIIGPRKSGKTTYLAALAYQSERQIQHQKRSQYKVVAGNLEAAKLTQKAALLIKKSLQLEPTRVNAVDELPYYLFTIERQLSILGRILNWRSLKQFYIISRDYPGDVFDSLASKSLYSPLINEYIDDLFIDKIGCIIMMSGWGLNYDKFYHSSLTSLLEIMYSRSDIKDYKIAVVMSKCERIELWPGRLNPESDLFEVHLPRTRDILRRRIQKENLKFFAISSFGVLGENDPRPNRENRIIHGEFLSVLRDSEKWQPYNLIEPLYWLSTGQVIPVLNRKFPALFSWQG
ncbi:MAG: hypothetical protein ACKN9A_14200 [Microcystis aeruginosa]